MLVLFRYTREAGVRSLERKIGAICRAVAVKVAEGHKVTKRDASTPEDSAQQGKSQSSLCICVLLCWDGGLTLYRQWMVSGKLLLVASQILSVYHLHARLSLCYMFSD